MSSTRPRTTTRKPTRATIAKPKAKPRKKASTAPRTKMSSSGTTTKQAAVAEGTNIAFSTNCLTSSPCHHDVLVEHAGMHPELKRGLTGDAIALLYIEHGYKVPEHFRRYIPASSAEREAANRRTIKNKTIFLAPRPSRYPGCAPPQVLKAMWEMQNGFIV